MGANQERIETRIEADVEKLGTHQENMWTSQEELQA
jgi:hypothetical protein